jgi:hypothetical protein
MSIRGLLFQCASTILNPIQRVSLIQSVKHSLTIHIKWMSVGNVHLCILLRYLLTKTSRAVYLLFSELYILDKTVVIGNQHECHQHEM